MIRVAITQSADISLTIPHCNFEALPRIGERISVLTRPANKPEAMRTFQVEGVLHQAGSAPIFEQPNVTLFVTDF